MIKLSREQRATRGTASAKTRAAWRERWGCDCDGRSHELGGYRPDGAHRSIRAIAKHIEELTGHEPPSCPWRALYDPLVAEVVGLANLGDEGFGQSALEPDPPAILLDALEVFIAAKRSVRAHYQEQARKKHERELEQLRAKNRGNRRRI